MEVMCFIIFLFGAIRIFKTKESRFPNKPLLGCTLYITLLAVVLYLTCTSINFVSDKAVSDALYNLGYDSVYKK